jgi:hypothetical protein
MSKAVYANFSDEASPVPPVHPLEDHVEEKKQFTQMDKGYKNGWKMEFMASKDIKTMSIYVGMCAYAKPTEFYPLGQVAKALPIAIQVVKESEGALVESEPFLRLRYEEAQGLMDELWSCGIRPTEVGSHGELGAVKSHLEDMRKMVFHYMGLTK